MSSFLTRRSGAAQTTRPRNGPAPRRPTRILAAMSAQADSSSGPGSSVYRLGIRLLGSAAWSVAHLAAGNRHQAMLQLHQRPVRRRPASATRTVKSSSSNGPRAVAPQYAWCISSVRALPHTTASEAVPCRGWSAAGPRICPPHRSAGLAPHLHHHHARGAGKGTRQGSPSWRCPTIWTKSRNGVRCIAAGV